MIPIRDANPTRRTPYVTRTLIVLNVLVFLYELSLGRHLSLFVYEWGMVPLRLTDATQRGTEPLGAAWLTLVTSTFLHGGFMHLIGNMWYLWIFGDNVEDDLGHARFLLFYLLAGAIAGYVHYATEPLSRIPTVGASGAIAAVLGAYLAMYPRARVFTLIPIFIFIQFVWLPAVVVLGMWFVYQLFSGAFSITSAAEGGVAWWAHIGGFAFGWLLFRIGGRIKPRPVSDAWVE